MNTNLHKKPKIVLIDDASFLVRIYKDYFEKADFEVKTYADVPDNLVEEVAKEKPDIISMDILMPKMDGFTATKLLKADERTKDIPVFGLSNMGDEDIFEEAKKVGMEKYFVTVDTPPNEYVKEVQKFLSNNPEVEMRQKPTQQMHSQSNNNKYVSKQALYFILGVFIPFILIVVVSLFFVDIGINSKFFIKKYFTQAFNYRITGDCNSFMEYVIAKELSPGEQKDVMDMKQKLKSLEQSREYIEKTFLESDIEQRLKSTLLWWKNLCKSEKIIDFEIKQITYRFSSDHAFLLVETKKGTHVSSNTYEMKKAGIKWKLIEN